MYKVLIFSMGIFIFTACSNKNSAFEYTHKSSVKSQIVQNRKKVDIIKNEEPKVIFWATYVNNIQEYKNLKNETFIVNIYFVNKNNQNLKDSNYFLSLNNNEAIRIKKLDNLDKEYKDFFLENTWGEHYLVEFKSLNDEKLNFKLSNKTNWAQLNFEK